MLWTNLSRALKMRVGKARHPGYNAGQPGIELSPSYFYNLGAVAAAGGELVHKDATSTELPAAAGSLVYTADTDGTSPADASTRLATTTLSINGVDVVVWVLPTPRNIVAVVTHGSSVVAMTIVLDGYDQYLQPVRESLAITATGTSKTGTGKKAYKYLRSITYTVAADATTNTVDIGTGVVLGMPFAALTKNHVTVRMDGVTDASATIVAADATTPSATTGDVRGTVTFNTPPDATHVYSAQVFYDPTSQETAFGKTQFAG